MDCSQVQFSFEEDTGKKLFEAERREIEKHLQACEACAKIRQTVEAAWNALDLLPAEKSDPFAPRRFVANLQRRTVKRQLSYSLAAAFLVLALAAQWLFHLAPHGGPAASDPGGGGIASTASLSFATASPGQDSSETALVGDINTLFGDVPFSNQEEDPL